MIWLDVIIPCKRLAGRVSSVKLRRSTACSYYLKITRRRIWLLFELDLQIDLLKCQMQHWFAHWFMCNKMCFFFPGWSSMGQPSCCPFAPRAGLEPLGFQASNFKHFVHWNQRVATTKSRNQTSPISLAQHPKIHSSRLLCRDALRQITMTFLLGWAVTVQR